MRINVAVNVRHEADGRQTPLAIIWEDGRKFEIDYVYDARRAASLKAGGVGMRYTCKIRSKKLYLFDEEGCWFLEG